MGEDTSDVGQNLGVMLALLRTARGWSQAELGRASGVPASSISQYEAGKKLPELKSLMRVLSAMGYGYSDLDKARFFLLSLGGGAAGGGHGIAAELRGFPSTLSEQVASMAAATGETVDSWAPARNW